MSTFKNHKLKYHIISFIYGKLSSNGNIFYFLKKDLFFGLDKNIRFSDST